MKPYFIVSSKERLRTGYMMAVSEYMNETVVQCRLEGKGDGHGW